MIGSADETRGASTLRRRLFLLAAKIAVVAMLYYAIFRAVSFPNVGALLTASLASAFAATVGLTLVQAAICTVRWTLLSNEVSGVPGFRVSFWIYLEGLFFNQALPSIIGGDAVRVLRWRAFGVRTGDAVSSVLLDRIFGVSGVSLLALMATMLLWPTPIERYKVMAVGGLSLLVVLVSMTVLIAAWSPRVETVLGRLPRLAPVLTEMRRLRPRRRVAAISLGYSVLGPLLNGIGTFLIARTLGIDLPMVLLVTLTAFIVLLSMIPVSLAGWGVREAGFLALLAPLGVDMQSAVLLGVLFGLTALTASLPGGLSVLFDLSSPDE